MHGMLLTAQSKLRTVRLENFFYSPTFRLSLGVFVSFVVLFVFI